MVYHNFSFKTKNCTHHKVHLLCCKTRKILISGEIKFIAKLLFALELFGFKSSKDCYTYLSACI